MGHVSSMLLVLCAFFDKHLPITEYVSTFGDSVLNYFHTVGVRHFQ